MEAKACLEFLVRQIHTTVVATCDESNLPVTCAVDLMDADETSLYFLTAEGKQFYRRLKAHPYLSLTGIKGADTLSCISVSVRGRVRELPRERIPELMKKNPYMYEIYPTAASQEAIRAFQIYDGCGEWFDLSVKPIQRFSFRFGNAQTKQVRYRIRKRCTGCASCLAVCPQGCIRAEVPFRIVQENCLRCGNCCRICPEQAIEKEEL